MSKKNKTTNREQKNAPPPAQPRLPPEIEAWVNEPPVYSPLEQIANLARALALSLPEDFQEYKRARAMLNKDWSDHPGMYDQLHGEANAIRNACLIALRRLADLARMVFAHMPDLARTLKQVDVGLGLSPDDPRVDLAPLVEELHKIRTEATCREINKDPFEFLLTFAEAELKGKERKVLEMLIKNGGKESLENLSLAVDWAIPCDNPAQKIKEKLNRKLRTAKMPYLIARQDNDLEIINPSKKQNPPKKA